jgi:hypothetical protein
MASFDQILEKPGRQMHNWQLSVDTWTSEQLKLELLLVYLLQG